MEVGEGSPEIVFFDVETTIPWRKGQRFVLLEFGAILVCPRKLVELQSFSTLLRPEDLSAVSEASTKCNGISREAVAGAPRFQDVADKIFDLLDGRVWAGHNVVSFDCVRIREAFADIGRPAPTAKGIIDSLRLLQNKFGRRAGNLKMATLANYFGLGSQKHRSLDDVRMNLEVLKYCATVLFLEENYPDVLLDEMSSTPLKLEMPDVSSSRSQRGKASGGTLSEGKVGKPSKKKSPEKNSVKIVSNSSVKENKEVSNSRLKEIKKLSGAPIKAMNSEADNGHFDLTDMNRLQSILAQGQALQEEHVGASSNPSNLVLVSVTEQSESNQSQCFLEPHEISTSYLRTSFIRRWGTEKMILLHKDLPLLMSSRKMKIRFGISKKFFVPTGKPKLSFVVEPSLETCEILKACDNLAQKLYSEFTGESEWKPLVLTKQGLVNGSRAIRMHIESIGAGETATYITELYQRDSSGTTKSFPFTNVDIDELDKMFVYGRLIDADYSFDIYDYQHNAGIRLVARRLTVDCGRY
uniref:Exonuclease domain-containing protein n=1 Tax=Araucaria cunninghamii TaxID=56994 RepID=A0A0D6R1T3_ARACU